LRQNRQIVIRSRHNRCEDDLCDVFACYPFDLEQLQQPHRILIARPAGIRGNSPTGFDLAPFKQREDNIGVSDIGS